MRANQEPASALGSCLEGLQKTWQKKGSLAGLLNDWKVIAGPQLSSNCSPVSLQRGVLIIGASHPQWRQALLYNRPQLLAALKAAGHKVRVLKIQQHHPREYKTTDSELKVWARHPSRIDVHGIAKCNLCGNPSSAGELEIWGKCCFCKQKELKEKNN
ncbi:DciA family protein [Prochlorococcus sp. MIT 1341]|uniref:DciA family protein n=1 Tax=Prochlorococcus sp. MIT 1341 TaxID=3096221 RepID=UPI002A7498AE|nr:DciA family protein [Prochlorococcus sp. MIT 1341]